MSKTAYVHANLLDGTEDMQVRENVAVLVKDGRIEAICDSSAVPHGYRVVDLKGKYLMPGLINLHVHLPGSGKKPPIKPKGGKSIQDKLETPVGQRIMAMLCAGNAMAALKSGVTTVRAVGGFADFDSHLRDQINAGKRQGPRILAANTAVSVPGGHMAGFMAIPARSVDEAVAHIKATAAQKPDLIKLMITGGVLDADDDGIPGAMKMPPEMVKACCDAAHALGYKVSAHVEGPVGMRVAAENGVDSLEHGAAAGAEVMAKLKENGAAVVCTISPTIPMTYCDPARTGMDPLMRENGKKVYEGIVACAKTALEAGISVGLGNDAGCPFITHYDFWREPEYFHRYVGVSRAFALHSATQVNARIAGIAQETGSIEPGKSADFLITEQNPLEDLRALRTPAMVVMEGKPVRGKKLKRDQKFDRVLDPVIGE